MANDSNDPKKLSDEEYAAYMAWKTANTASGTEEGYTYSDPIPPDGTYVTVQDAKGTHFRTVPINNGQVVTHPEQNMTTIEDLSNQLKNLKGRVTKLEKQQQEAITATPSTEEDWVNDDA